MRELLRQHRRFFFLATLSALALRLLFFFLFPAVTSDSLLYGDIAKNWLQHGIYGITDAGRIVPTAIRLPGYPGVLAFCFAIFGVDHYRPVLLLQILVDLGTCLLMADMARRVVSRRAAKAAFLLAALCPFFANYAAAALTETLEIFLTALALDWALIGVVSLPGGRLRPWLGCGAATAAAILLRPDGGLLLIAIGVYLMWLWLRPPSSVSRTRVVQAAVVFGFVCLAPLVPWTLRNLHTLHEFQPLAPRYATQPNEVESLGFDRWVKTWVADYVSVEEIYWSVPGEPLDITKLPARAFDSAQQRAETARLFSDYNQVLQITPPLDARFAALAAERIRATPLRYYLWLPVVRIADMWLRPRTELLPADTRWWEFNDDPVWSAAALLLGIIGVLYVLTAIAGLVRRPFGPGTDLLLLFLLLRSAFLGTLENPEPRYTLECYPVLFILICLNLRSSHRPENERAPTEIGTAL